MEKSTVIWIAVSIIIIGIIMTIVGIIFYLKYKKSNAALLSTESKSSLEKIMLGMWITGIVILLSGVGFAIYGFMKKKRIDNITD